MGDRINKISKEKRHRSSSSLVGGAVGSTRSERKLELTGLIPEMGDHFAQAEARCKELHEKIELVKALKRKRKLIKKRSLSNIENVPLISVQTMPKKNAAQSRLPRLEQLDNLTLVDPHKLLRGYNRVTDPQEQAKVIQNATKMQKRRRNMRQNRAEGDIANGIPDVSATAPQYLDDVFEQPTEEYNFTVQSRQPDDLRKSSDCRRRNIKEDDEKSFPQEEVSWAYCPQKPSRKMTPSPVFKTPEERPIVELFNKNKAKTQSPQASAKRKVSANRKENKAWNWKGSIQNIETANLEVGSSHTKPTKDTSPRRGHHRGYELPTVSSQLKQAGTRFCYNYDAQQTCIPFVPSGSTAPSYNIGVNIQRVLSSVKKQQPLSGIPLTIAHHMGLRHLPYNAMSSHQDASLDKEEINLIQAGGQQVRLPSCKSLSFNKILNMYREGDGMVPRFLKAIRSTHFFYPVKHSEHAYDATNAEDAVARAVCSSKAKFNQDAKKSLAEYASLYSQYQQLEQNIVEGPSDPEVERQRYELANELAAREEHIQQVLQEYQSKANIGASASPGRDKCTPHKRLNSGDENRIYVY